MRIWWYLSQAAWRSPASSEAWAAFKAASTSEGERRAAGAVDAEGAVERDGRTSGKKAEARYPSRKPMATAAPKKR